MSFADAPRQRILDAALELLAEHGVEGTSLQQVADRVGLHKSTLFHHFKSKDELVGEVFRGLGERLLKRLEPILAEDPPRFESLLAALDASVEHFADEPAAGRLLMRLMVTSRGLPAEAPALEANAIDRVLIVVGVWLARARRRRDPLRPGASHRAQPDGTRALLSRGRAPHPRVGAERGSALGGDARFAQARIAGVPEGSARTRMTPAAMMF